MSDFVAKMNLGVDPNLTQDRARKQKYYSPRLRNCFDWSALQVRIETDSVPVIEHCWPGLPFHDFSFSDSKI